VEEFEESEMDGCRIGFNNFYVFWENGKGKGGNGSQNRFYNTFIKNGFTFFCAGFTAFEFKVSKKCNYYSNKFYFQTNHYGYQKKQNFMLSSNPQKSFKKIATKKVNG